MLYAAKCYWPGVTESEVRRAGARAAEGTRSSHRDGVDYLGSLLFANDELVLCLFEGPSRTAVTRATEDAGIPCERLMNSIWIKPDLGKDQHR
jgi:hypothetical protein